MGRRFCSRVAAAAGLAAAAGVSLSFYQPAWLLRQVEKITPGVIWAGPDQGRELALTFDDGPDPCWTPQVLDHLRQRNVPATFFLIGENAAAHPALVRRIAEAGHQIGNHMWRDENALLMSDEEAEQSLEKTEQVLFAITGMAPDWMRPAGGLPRPSLVKSARQLGYRVVIASAYASDPRRPPAAYIAWAMTMMMRPGAILVLHDSGGDRSQSLAALPAILDAGHRLGYRFVTLDEMFRRSS